MKDMAQHMADTYIVAIFLYMGECYAHRNVDAYEFDEDMTELPVRGESGGVHDASASKESKLTWSLSLSSKCRGSHSLVDISSVGVDRFSQRSR